MSRWWPSRHEWMQFAVALWGLGADRLWGHQGIALFLAGVGIGLVFEVAAKPLWAFHPSLASSRWTVNGVNVFVALAWGGLLTGSLAVATLLKGRVAAPSAAVLALVLGMLGNAVETLFSRLGAIVYRLDHPVLAFPFRRAPLLLGVPASIRLGYFTSMPALALGLSALFGPEAVPAGLASAAAPD